MNPLWRFVHQDPENLPRRRPSKTREESATVGEPRRRFENRDPGIPPGASPIASVTLAIQTALLPIHRRGFVRNGIRKDNILIQCNGGRFYASLIDFAFSKQGFWCDF